MTQKYRFMPPPRRPLRVSKPGNRHGSRRRSRGRSKYSRSRRGTNGAAPALAPIGRGQKKAVTIPSAGLLATNRTDQRPSCRRLVRGRIHLGQCGRVALHRDGEHVNAKRVNRLPPAVGQLAQPGVQARADPKRGQAFTLHFRPSPIHQERKPMLFLLVTGARS